MSPTGDGRRSERVGRAREGLRKGSERAGARLARGTGRAEALLARGLGEPALFAIILSAIVSSIFFSIGVVSDDALGLTPVVFLVAAIFFVTTMATYVEGNSLHPERGGASTFARYAFDEFWSFVAGWAILLDYLIVMALAAVAISDYLAAFWGELGSGLSRDGHRSAGVPVRGHGQCQRPRRRAAAAGAAPVARRDRPARDRVRAGVRAALRHRAPLRHRGPRHDARPGRASSSQP